MFNIEKRNPNIELSAMFFLVSFLAYTVFKNIGLAVIIFLFLAVFLLKNKVYLLKEDVNVIFIFYLMFLISFAVVCLFSLLILGKSYIDFYPRIFGRILNITVYFAIFLFVIDEKNREKITTGTLFNAYLIGCYILLFFGIWQILNMLTGVPYPDFNTKDYFHSINTSKISAFLTKRITSLASEPSYLMPFAIDAVIILFYTTKKHILTGLFIILVFFSMALSGYINLFFIIMAIIFLARKTKKNVIVTVFILLCGIFIIFKLQNNIFAVITRLNPGNLLLSNRAQEAILPVKYMFFDAPAFNVMFGFGPKGMGYLAENIVYASGWLKGQNITTSTHIVIIDFFVEHGIAGFIMIIALFSYLFLLSTRVFKKTGNRLAQILCINLFITSLYLSDFASTRFTAIIILLLCLYKDSKDENSKIINV